MIQETFFAITKTHLKGTLNQLEPSGIREIGGESSASAEAMRKANNSTGGFGRPFH